MSKRHLRYIKKPHFDLALQALWRDHRYNEVKYLIRYLKKWQLSVPQEYYAALSSNCARLGTVQRALAYISNMQKEHPDYPVTADMYDGHFAFWSSKGKLGKAKRYFEEMKKKGASPAASNYFEMLVGYSKFPKANKDEIDIIRKEMEEANISFTPEHAQMVVEALTLAGFTDFSASDFSQ